MMGMGTHQRATSPTSPNLSNPNGSGEGNAEPKRLLTLALLACVVAATLGAQPLAAWVNASIVTGTFLQDAANSWLSVTQHVGLDRPYTILRHAIRDAEAAQFPGRD